MKIPNVTSIGQNNPIFIVNKEIYSIEELINLKFMPFGS